MKTALLTLATLALLARATAQQDCSMALAVGLGVHQVAAVDGAVPDAPRCANHDQGAASHAAWFSFTATNDTIVHITTDVSGQPQVDTRFHVYTGGCDALQCVVGNDNGGANGTSRAAFEALQGETYYIVFDDRWSASGFSFLLEEIFYSVANMESYVQFQSTFMNIQGAPLAVVDMNNDGLDDAIGVTQTLIHINYQLPDGAGFDPIGYPTEYASYPASWSLCAGDLDGNGYKDLLYGGGSGVSFMYAVDGGQGFQHRSTPEYVFSQRSNMVDIDNDGNLDAFVCHDVAPNVFYMNNSDGQLTFAQGGLGNSCGNYGSIWMDYDNDGDMDLYIAKCGCDPIDVLMRNDGNGEFMQVPGPLGPVDYHQSWSSAWGDLDNDGDMDAVIGGSSSPQHHLMRNDGNGIFTDITAGSGIDAFFGQGIEWVTHDLNNDGRLDILGAGSLLVNLGEMRFGWNSWYPGVGGVGDLNGDGSLDVFGYSGVQFAVPNGNHWSRVALHGTVSNRDGIGARVTVESALGSQVREVRSGEGFKYMSSLMPHFGLGPDTQIDRIIVRWPSGIVQEMETPYIDQVVHITEPVNTAVSDGPHVPVLGVYPNPGSDRLTFSGVQVKSGMAVRITDMTGRVVGQHLVMDGSMPIGDLAPGMYSAGMLLNGSSVELRFRKE
ncbi:MAG: VCBS repeat-containing protein [Flavobacteriales bacterium]|nr:VCBS repeat-containing protein [Flavobacteriales bacterium]